MPIVSGHIEDEICHVSILGDIDMFTSKEIKSELWELVQNKKFTELYLNFQNVNYIDSTGIGSIMHFVKMLRQYGTKVKVENIKDRIRTVLCLAGLEKFFMEN
jgi:anti-sigma B factor antagonist